MIFDEYAIKSLIRPVPGFPKEGVTFRDITPLFQSPKALRMVADSLIQRYIDSPVTHIGAIDARGFLIGSILAYELNRPLVLFRKAGKLPGEVVGVDYQLEYGTDRMEMHADAVSQGDDVLLVDDLIATGGTASAAVELIRGVGGTVVEACFVIDLPELGGTDRLRALHCDCFTLCEFEGA